jgi:CheY-like chemotaxis protein
MHEIELTVENKPDSMIHKFVVVDDDPDDVDLFLEAISEISHTTCLSAKDGRDLLGKLASGEITNPDIIFLDVNMPDMNGWECLVKLKSNADFKSLPVIMYSTSSAKKDAEKALALGALGFYEKPANFLILKEFLKILASRPDLDEKSIQALARDCGRNQKFFV